MDTVAREHLHEKQIEVVLGWNWGGIPRELFSFWGGHFWGGISKNLNKAKTSEWGISYRILVHIEQGTNISIRTGPQ